MNWTVADSKARLSEVLRLARSGVPQIVGTQDPCVIISLAEYERLLPKAHGGRALLALATRFRPIETVPEDGAQKRGQLPSKL